MARFEHPTDLAFCEVALEGKVVAVRRGARGEKGKLEATSFATPAAARKHHDKLVAGLVKSGYHDPKAAKQKKLVAANEPMLAAIEADPADESTRLVYADWLQTHGDPRGELIVLQQVGQKKKASGLIRKHAELWLGSLADKLGHSSSAMRPDIDLTWHLGFLDRVELRSSYGVKTVEDLANLASARFVRELVLGGTDDYRAAVRVMDKTRWPACLEKLSIGHQLWGEYLPGSNQTGDVAPLIARSQRLVEIDLTLGSSKLGALTVPRVRRFTMCGCTPTQLASITKAKWPALERLGIRMAENKQLAAVLAMKLAAPKLRELDLHVWRDDQVAMLLAQLPKAPLMNAIEKVHVVADAAEYKALAPALRGIKSERIKDPAEVSI